MNIQHSFSHTDLALELKDELEESLEEQQAFDGIKIHQERIGERGLQETVIEIDSEEGEKQLGKPQGIYVTLEGENMAGNDGSFHEEMSECLAKRLQSLLSGKRKLLFIGLGNGEVTPDALGPLVIKNLFITRHLTGWKEIEGCPAVAALAPGVMAQTGIETSSIIKGIADEIDPGVIIVIDALAARNTHRLNKTIQISNRGINPGSGVGNHRTGITSDNIGVPVIAVGVPTVIDAATIIGDVTKDYENIPKHLSDMYVTPKDIDENIRITAEIIAESINELVYA